MITGLLFNHSPLVLGIALVESTSSVPQFPLIERLLTCSYADLSLAYVEMRIVLARLLWNFDLAGLAPSCEEWADQNVYLFWDKPELLIKLKPIMKEPPRWVQA